MGKFSVVPLLNYEIVTPPPPQKTTTKPAIRYSGRIVEVVFSPMNCNRDINSFLSANLNNKTGEKLMFLR